MQLSVRLSYLTSSSKAVLVFTDMVTIKLHRQIDKCEPCSIQLWAWSLVFTSSLSLSTMSFLVQ